MEKETLLTTGQAAKYLNVHRETIKRKVRIGLIPAFTIGGRFRFHQDDLDSYLEKVKYHGRK